MHIGPEGPWLQPSIYGEGDYIGYMAERGMYLNWNYANFQARVALDRVGKKIIFANGCFDLLHAGHISTLNWAKYAANEAMCHWRNRLLVVAVNSDQSVEAVKGKPPIVPFLERAYSISALAGVDLVVGFGEETPLQLIEFLMPDLIIKGPDYQFKNIIGGPFVRGALTAPAVFDVSTTKIIERLESKKRN